MYYVKLADEILTYIEKELRDGFFYNELALKAPTPATKEILIELGNDEMIHAENFTQAYYYLTGKMYVPKSHIKIDVPGYEEALKIRILAEAGDYRQYGEAYMEAPNKYLRDLFFTIKMIEASHARRVPVLLQDLYC